MTTERQWVSSFIKKLDNELSETPKKDFEMSATDGTKLAYACEIQKYRPDVTPVVTTNKHETDILISDITTDGS